MQSSEELTMFCDQQKDSPKIQELFHQGIDPHRLSAKVLQQHSPVLNIITTNYYKKHKDHHLLLF